MKKIYAYMIAAISFLAIGIPVVSATPLTFPPSVSTAPATSTYSQIPVGTGTTTLTYDTFAPTAVPNFATDHAVLFIQDNASSTSSVLKISFQYSQNCVDWYSDFVNISTTTIPATVSQPFYWSYTSPITGTTSIILPFQTPTRCVRATFASTAGTSSVWAQITPEEQSFN